jgi:hypothetical protein
VLLRLEEVEERLSDLLARHALIVETVPESGRQISHNVRLKASGTFQRGGQNARVSHRGAGGDVLEVISDS